jgi:hypothetical protein
LFIEPCSRGAARFAVEHWHYSRRLPGPGLRPFGVWEDGRFVGVVLFGAGATPEIGLPFGLEKNEVLELVRIALQTHTTTVTRICKVAIGLLRHAEPSLRLIVSYADPNQGHIGRIYQAGNWIYVGETIGRDLVVIHGAVMHGRCIRSRYGGGSIKFLRQYVDPQARRAKPLYKHKYVYPLDPTIRARVEAMRKPYPQLSCLASADGGMVVDQIIGGGSIPTARLNEQSALVVPS